MSKIGIGCVFPIWKIDSDVIAGNFIEAGFKDVIICVDTKVFNGGFAGRQFDGDFITDLPPGIDTYGENCELHTNLICGVISYIS